MKTVSSEGDTVPLKNTTGAVIKSDQPIILGGFTGVATEDVQPDQYGEFFVRGQVRIAAAGASAAATAADGAIVYYNSTTKALTMTKGTNKPFAKINGPIVDGNMRRAWLLSAVDVFTAA